MNQVRVAAVAFRSEFGEPDANLTCMLDWIDRAAEQGTKLVCFPETALQGYCTPPKLIADLVEPIGGPRYRALAERAKARDITVSTGMMVRDGGKIYNSQVFIGPSGLVGVQHKMHLCPVDHPYDPGDQWSVFEWNGLRIGTTICFDSYFPESARVLALQGADIVVMSFACGRRAVIGGAIQPGAWACETNRWAPSRAFDNRVFVIACNHAGTVPDPHGRAISNPYNRPGVEEWAPPGTIHQWTGYSFILDPAGQIVAESPRDQHDANMIVADLDLELLNKHRKPLVVKNHDGFYRGDFLAVRRQDSFDALVEPMNVPSRRAEEVHYR